MMMLKMMMPVSLLLLLHDCTESDKNVKSANLHKPSFAQSMPKMPGGDDGEKKEETAESREEAKEQVITIIFFHFCLFFQILHNIWSSTNITEIVIILMQRLG